MTTSFLLGQEERSSSSSSSTSRHSALSIVIVCRVGIATTGSRIGRFCGAGGVGLISITVIGCFERIASFSRLRRIADFAQV